MIMILIVGLGNPGKKFQNTRHNIGREAVESWQSAVGFPDFRFEKKFNALVSNGLCNKKKIILALPETFMNNSGKVVRPLATKYKIQNTDLIVIHDDIDLFLGKIKISKKRGSAGHKGVESIIQELKTKNFIRVRVGVQPETGKPKNTEKFVLEKFNKKELEKLREVFKTTYLIIKAIIKEGVEKAMQKYNQ